MRCDEPRKVTEAFLEFAVIHSAWARANVGLLKHKIQEGMYVQDLQEGLDLPKFWNSFVPTCTGPSLVIFQNMVKRALEMAKY